MLIAGLAKLSLLDYPDHLAATVFTPGCNFACPFCHNKDLVLKEALDYIDEQDVFDFLSMRTGLIDAVCISGGEPTLQRDLDVFCTHVHDRGFLVKLDTNGSNPRLLSDLIERGLVDYVAIDVKNTAANYALTAHADARTIERVRKSVSLLLQGRIAYELRTTVTRELHRENDLLELADKLSQADAWYIQNFKDAPGVLGGTGRFHPWNAEELAALLPQLQRLCPNVHLRGIA